MAARHGPSSVAARDLAEDEDRWQSAWSHREALLRVARRRSVCEADAQDAVGEAILRSQETDGIDSQRLGAWLTSVTMRLCVDRARDRGREPKRIAYQRRQGFVVADHAEEICDRAEAGWLVSHLADLPPRQRRALQLRADGMDVAAVAAAMDITENAAEGLLQRARTHLRAVLAKTACWIGLLVASLVAATRRSSTATAATATVLAATSAVLWGATDTRAADPSQAVAPAAPSSAATAPDKAPADVASAATAPRTDPAALPEPVIDGTLRDPTAGPRPPARPVELPSVRPPTREPSSVEVAGVGVRDGGTSYHQSDETMLESTQRCLEQGPEVSAEFIGCRPQ